MLPLTLPPHHTSPTLLPSAFLPPHAVCGAERSAGWLSTTGLKICCSLSPEALSPASNISPLSPYPVKGFIYSHIPPLLRILLWLPITLTMKVS